MVAGFRRVECRGIEVFRRDRLGRRRKRRPRERRERDPDGSVGADANDVRRRQGCRGAGVFGASPELPGSVGDGLRLRPESLLRRLVPGLLLPGPQHLCAAGDRAAGALRFRQRSVLRVVVPLRAGRRRGKPRPGGLPRGLRLAGRRGMAGRLRTDEAPRSPRTPRRPLGSPKISSRLLHGNERPGKDDLRRPARRRPGLRRPHFPGPPLPWSHVLEHQA
mmetsp:Transcript_26759/g.86644  ORF Transcript_26759/g.86644 Transcript_26759/m.86644 type:complete len:220 (+) Transcript_26759:480-1139(+)